MPSNTNMVHHDQFVIGRNHLTVFEPGEIEIGALKLSRPFQPVFCTLDNRGPNAFTVEVLHSDSFLTDPPKVRATGSIELTANPADTDTITIDDNEGTTVIFEFDSGGGITGDVAVTIGVDAEATLAVLKTAIEGTALNITLATSTSAVNPTLDVTHVTYGASGNSATIADASTAVTTVTFANGAINVPTVRHEGATVTSITIVAGGRVGFILEGTIKPYLQFTLQPAVTDGAVSGSLSVMQVHGDAERRSNASPINA